MHSSQFIEELYHDHIDLVYRFIYHKVLSKTTAEDLTSTVFLKALQHCHRYDARKAKASTWLLTIARNTVIDYFRTQKPAHTSIEDVWDLSDGYSLTKEVDDLLNNEQLRTAMQSLTAEEREILTLRFWQDYSFPEIGTMLGKPANTVKMTCFRAVKKLRDTMPLFVLLGIAL